MQEPDRVSTLVVSERVFLNWRKPERTIDCCCRLSVGVYSERLKSIQFLQTDRIRDARLNQIVFLFPGPAFWGLINPEWSLCNKGMRQSPVNLDPDKLLYDPNLTELLVSRHRVSVYDRVSGRQISRNADIRTREKRKRRVIISWSRVGNVRTSVRSLSGAVSPALDFVGVVLSA